MSNVFLRQWMMLNMIPSSGKISAQALQYRLVEEGFEVDLRTIQRDLVKLSELIPTLQCDEHRPAGWSKVGEIGISKMDMHTALTFHLVQRYLEPVLPQSTLQHLQPYFGAATKVLDTTNGKKGLPTWKDKIRVMHRGPVTHSPEVSCEVQKSLDEALIYNKQLYVRYHPRWQEGEKEYEINPLGIVLKDGIFYVVCTMWSYSDVKLLALHRFIEAKLIDKPLEKPNNFDLDAYMASGELNFAVGKDIKLKAIISQDVATHLIERPLGAGQSITKLKDEGYQLQVTVQDSYELLWWILGYGEAIKVISPKRIASFIRDTAGKVIDLYNS